MLSLLFFIVFKIILHENCLFDFFYVFFKNCAFKHLRFLQILPFLIDRARQGRMPKFEWDRFDSGNDIEVFSRFEFFGKKIWACALRAVRSVRPDGFFICSIFGHLKQWKFAQWSKKLSNQIKNYYPQHKNFFAKSGHTGRREKLQNRSTRQRCKNRDERA